jgi:hypothetical protein|tara:strand:+ start:913 stop:1230 length:318 start_codon:yes stop_codon:yes gene_type:complete
MLNKIFTKLPDELIEQIINYAIEPTLSCRAIKEETFREIKDIELFSLKPICGTIKITDLPVENDAATLDDMYWLGFYAALESLDIEEEEEITIGTNYTYTDQASF